MYYLTTLAAWQRHAHRFTGSHWIALGTQAVAPSRLASTSQAETNGEGKALLAPLFGVRRLDAALPSPSIARARASTLEEENTAHGEGNSPSNGETLLPSTSRTSEAPEARHSASPPREGWERGLENFSSAPGATQIASAADSPRELSRAADEPMASSESNLSDATPTSSSSKATKARTSRSKPTLIFYSFLIRSRSSRFPPPRIPPSHRAASPCPNAPPPSKPPNCSRASILFSAIACFDNPTRIVTLRPAHLARRRVRVHTI
jgi:hypothetical protein